MKPINRIFFAATLMILPVAQLAAQQAWVSDQFEVTLRTGPSINNAIERMLPSGTALEILERDDEAGYARVRTAAGTELHTSFALDTAGEHLALTAPDGGSDTQPTGKTPTLEDWRGNSGSIDPIR